MYANNFFAKRRPDGWAERRRHFRRLFEGASNEAAKPEETRKVETDEPKR